MSESEPVQSYNRKIWDRIAAHGDKYFVALPESKIADAKNGSIKIRVTPTKWVPEHWIGNVSGKEVLCLACGGGQQAPLFAAAGANVTVYDISEEQLSRDREAAQKHQLELKTVQGDMADMSQLGDDHFDLIVNPCSVCYCPELSNIWSEVSRVLKPGGRFISGWVKPVNYLFDPIAMEEDQELVVARKIPYSDMDLEDEEREQILGTERAIEFGHSLFQLIGGQIESGLNITGFYEDRWGDDDLLSDHIDVFAATCAIMPEHS